MSKIKTILRNTLIVIAVLAVNNIAVVGFMLYKKFYTSHEYVVTKAIVNEVLQDNPDILISAVNHTEKVLQKRKEVKEKAIKWHDKLVARKRTTFW